MCGIAAHISYGTNGAAGDRAGLARACDAMATRGPDGEGVWVSPDGAAGLGHRRLSIIDLSAGGAQPMALDEPPLAIAFNGEIYNHADVRRDLEGRGHRFRSSSDTEVILRAYAEYGEAAVGRFRGMFAFALWDGRRREVLLARDPYGIKPLYVADDGRRVTVASQVKALLRMGGVDTSLDPAGHVGFFLWGHVPEPFTLYRGIRAFPPGHTQWVGGPSAQPPKAFGTVGGALRDADASRQSVSAAEADEAVREALLSSVRAHLVADVDVGVFLSAGRDSTTLAALVAEAGGRLRTVTLGFDEYAGTDDDEAPLAEAVARKYGADHRTVRVGEGEFAGLLDGFLGAMDQPTIDGLNTYLVSRAAAQSGLKVVLSGLGGDELFGGYPSFSEVPRLASLVGAVPGHRAIGRAVRAASEPLVRRFASPKAAGLVEYGGSFPSAYLLRRSLFMPYELDRILGPDLAREGLARLEPLLALSRTVEGIRSDRLRITGLESEHYMRSQLLRDSDWASMAHSIELRVPLVDYDLLRGIAPMAAASPDRVDKAAMARAARPALPEEVASRAKTGFTTPVSRWLEGVTGQQISGRGLRGWARYVYGRHAGEAAPDLLAREVTP